MIRTEVLQGRLPRAPRFKWVLWAALAVATYLLAYSLATTNADTSIGDWPDGWELPIQGPIHDSFEWFGDTFAWFFNPIARVLDMSIAGADALLLWLPWPVIVVAVALVGHRLGGARLGLLTGGAILFVGLNGYWDSAMITVSMVGVSVLIAVGLGVPIGILAAFSNRFEAIVRPILDTMQVLPAFVYLIPAIVLFGVSGAQGVFLTVVYSIAPVIRLTNLGIRQVPQAVVETAHSHGSTTSQTLFQVQIPLAKSSIMMGVNQTIMMAVAMVILTALVGVQGLAGMSGNRCERWTPARDWRAELPSFCWPSSWTGSVTPWRAPVHNQRRRPRTALTTARTLPVNHSSAWRPAIHSRLRGSGCWASCCCSARSSPRYETSRMR